MLIIMLKAALASPAVMNGNYILDEPLSAAQKRRSIALEKTLNSANFIVRAMASSRLENKPNICESYVFHQSNNKLEVTCDQQPNITVMLDGSPSRYPKPDGSFLEVIAKVDGDSITQEFAGSAGALTVSWIFRGEQILVRKQLSSSYFTVPLVLELPYRRVDDSK